MTKSTDLREIAIFHYQNGKNTSEIVNFLANKVHRAAIYRWIRRYCHSGSLLAGKTTGRSRSGRTRRLINLVAKRITFKSKRKSSRLIARDFKSNKSTILQVIKEDLGKKRYRKISTQQLQDHHKLQRKRCCAWIRKNVKRTDLQTMMFTDENNIQSE